MALYKYTAYDAHGVASKGLIESESEVKARQQLRERGLVPMRVSMQTQFPSFLKQLTNKQSFNRISSANLVLVTREFATLLAAGTPLDESLSTVAEQIETPYLKTVLLGVQK